jgi:hypothetical protein
VRPLCRLSISQHLARPRDEEPLVGEDGRKLGLLLAKEAKVAGAVVRGRLRPTLCRHEAARAHELGDARRDGSAVVPDAFVRRHGAGRVRR